MQANVYAAINQVIKSYVTGMTRGDAGALAKAFHSRAVIVGNVDGVEAFETLADFSALCVDRAIPEGEPMPPYTVESISLAGDTAVARCLNSFDGQRYRDTLNLLRGAGGWVIVAKIFEEID